MVWFVYTVFWIVLVIFIVAWIFRKWPVVCENEKVSSFVLYLALLVFLIVVSSFALNSTSEQLGVRYQGVKERCPSPQARNLSDEEKELCRSRADLEKEFSETARNNLTAAETILFATITVYLFIIFSLWDAFHKSYADTRQALGVRTGATALLDAAQAEYHNVVELSDFAKPVFLFYGGYVALLSLSLFLLWPLVPFMFESPDRILGFSIAVKYLTGISTGFALFFLIVYVRLVHPTLRLIRDEGDTRFIT